MSLFSPETLCCTKVGIWVLKDEISRYARNDKVGAYVIIFYTVILEIAPTVIACEPLARYM
jgi:hypothetical protein